MAKPFYKVRAAPRDEIGSFDRDPRPRGAPVQATVQPEPAIQPLPDLLNLKPGTTVSWRDGILPAGIGRVVGIALIAQPVIGRMVIVQVPENMREKLSGWECVILPEVSLVVENI